MAENRALIPGTMYTHADGLKEAKDLSKNLVGGDFERQYKGKEPCRWRQNILIKIILAVLTVWLLTITVLREVQLSQLRKEVDILTANMIVVTASVNKISDNRLLHEFQTLEDTIYADDDNLVSDTDKDTVKEGRDESLEKLHDLTVLEDDTQPGDDEDMFEDDDDDDEESGDWYMDYDRRGRKVITTNMVRLKPEDFTDAVLSKQDSVSNIREIKRILNENPEIDSVLSALPTEKPKEASNEVHKRDRRSFFPEVSSESSPEFAVPNVISRMDERRKTKKYSPDRDVGIKVHTVSRTARNSDDEEGGSRRPFVAAHFHGNTSHLSTSVHDHYKGNGLIRVAHGAAHDVWYPAPWTVASPHPRPTLTKNGHIHVHHTGVYLVYVQIYYLDSHDVISWVLHRTNADIDGRETLLQCAQSSHSSERMDKPNSCFSAAALFLRSGDRLAVRNTGGERHSIMEPEKSFIGLIKLADAEEPNEEM